LIGRNAPNFSNTLRKVENSEVLKWIHDNTPEPLRNWNYKLSTIIYWILNDIDDFPKCKSCGKPIGINRNVRFTKGYPLYCRRCALHSAESNEKRKRTCIEKYGVDNPFKSKEIISKIHDTNIEKYGTACPAQSKENREKTKKKNLEKYGTEFYQSTEEYKQKVRDTCMRKYGVTDVFHVDDV
jgi:hypothetical protein